MANLFDFVIKQEDRLKITRFKPRLIWFTGLSGSGKSTLANALEIKLHEAGYLTYVLDGDNLRAGINTGLGFSKEDRHENLRRVAEIAKILMDSGITVIGAFVSPLESDRLLVKEIVGEENYLEIFVSTPLEICEARDVKGLYKKARAGEISEFTGISSPFEWPQNADLVVNGSLDDIDILIDYVFNTLFINEEVC